MEMERTQKKGLMRVKVGEGVLENVSVCILQFDFGYKEKKPQADATLVLSCEVVTACSQNKHTLKAFLLDFQHEALHFSEARCKNRFECTCKYLKE